MPLLPEPLGQRTHPLNSATASAAAEQFIYRGWRPGGGPCSSMGRTINFLEAVCFHCFMWIDACFSVFLRIIGCAMLVPCTPRASGLLDDRVCAHRPILVCAANGLIGFVTYMYLTVLAPVYLTPRLGATGTACVVCVGLFILFNILFNYWSCVLTKPGWPGHYLAGEELDSSEEQGTSVGAAGPQECGSALRAALGTLSRQPGLAGSGGARDLAARREGPARPARFACESRLVILSVLARL